MRIGISLTSNYPDAQDPRQGARWMIERAAAAQRAGLDSLFVGDQHVSPTPYYQNTPMLGRLLAEWGEAPAGCLFLLPLWHSVLVAEQIGTLAAIARGPFIMQCGLGWGEARFAAMGANIRTRPSAFEEALDKVRPAPGGRDGEFIAAVPGRRSEPGAASGRAGRGLDRRERAARHRPRGTTGEGLDREPRPHPRGGARAGRSLSRALRRLRPAAKRCRLAARHLCRPILI